ncbi:MAG TPA: protein kinase [Thermoanaerobaculia bacterium]
MATTHCLRCKAELDRSFKACPHCGEPVSDFSRRYADEPIDGKYEIVERLGAGGMGDVYKVTHRFLGATRVIKVIRAQISESSEAHERFLREARAATKVQHPNVATLHDFSELPDGSHYMVWEYIEGENLAQRIRARGTLPPRYAVQLAIQALHGLEAIHRAGIIHRDISPENLMITREQDGEERVRIIDLGVAKLEDSTDNATRAGVFVGKLRYASPEHLGFLQEGERIDARADLYSMGVVLYEMLTGRPPFEATSPHQYVLIHSRDSELKPRALPPDLPGSAELQAVLPRALDRDRNKRFGSAREFANALEGVEKSLPDPSKLRTMDLAKPDADDTWRVTPPPQTTDTLRRSTIRTGISEPPPAADTRETIRTPLPAELIPPAVVPPPRQTTAAAPRERSVPALVLVAVIAILAGAAIVFVLMRKPAQQPAVVPTTTVAQTATQQPPARAQSNVDVVSPAPVTTTTSAAPAITTSTTNTAATTPPPRKKAAVEKPAEPREQPAPVEKHEPAPPASSVKTYVDGGDSSTNEQLLSDLRRQIHGETRVTIHANSEMLNELTKQMKHEVPGVTIAEGADTVIDFNGAVEHLRLGRKRRSAHATVSKNGHVIFRYELAAEEYRVGDTPVEAFVRVLSDALK